MFVLYLLRYLTKSYCSSKLRDGILWSSIEVTLFQSLMPLICFVNLSDICFKNFRELQTLSSFNNDFSSFWSRYLSSDITVDWFWAVTLSVNVVWVTVAAVICIPKVFTSAKQNETCRQNATFISSNVVASA